MSPPASDTADRPAHGGDVAGAAARTGRPASAWLDLSTGINPWPYPVPPLAAETWTRLPQRDAEARLTAAARTAYGAGKAAAIVAAPGTQAILQWLPRLIAPVAVGVVEPTYGEHGAQWRAAGHAVADLADLAAADAFAAGEGPRVVALGQPNNPDGRHWPPAGLIGLADRLAAAGGWLVADEAFAEAMPGTSIAAAAGRPGLIVLKSFGKIFGLAGLRLGFALAPTALCDALSRALGAWAVSGPALAVGAAALEDRDWLAATRPRLDDAARRLDGVLTRAGCRPLGGTPLLRLVETPGAAGDLADRLAGHAILVRRFDAHPRWLRFGLPGAEGDWRRLTAALGVASAAGAD